ncbi:MAG: sensor histidine kinase [Jatrophihabitantaceae bacterium]
MALAIVAWCLLIGLAPVDARLPRELVPAAARSVASSLFLIAGVVRLVRWRMAGDAGAGRAAVALLVLGAAVRVHPLFGQSLTEAQPNPAVHTLCLTLVFALLLPTVNWSDPRRNIRFRLTAGFAAIGLVSTAVLIVRATRPVEMNVVWVVVDCAAAVGWMGLASRSWRASGQLRRGTAFWPCSAMLLMSAGEWTLAWSIAGNRVVTGIAAGLQLAAAFVVTCISLSDLRTTFSHEDTQNADATRVLADMQRQLADTVQTQRERLHDARSAIVGVIAASDLLAGGGMANVLDRDRLSRLMVHELHRLQTVLDTDDVEPIAEFDLVDSLEPVVLIHQLDGRTIRTDLRSLPVIGRPRVTATVLDNLLRNARVHAPDARIAVHANCSGSVATVVVEDDGPGIPPGEYDLVLHAGGRGSSTTAPGSGLGLFNAANAMREQGGSLQLSSAIGGGTRVTLTLPAAPARASDRALAS